MEIRYSQTTNSQARHGCLAVRLVRIPVPGYFHPVHSWHQDGIFFARMGLTGVAADHNTRKLQNSPRSLPHAMQGVARRKLRQSDAATGFDFLRVPPGRRLEALKGGRPAGTEERFRPEFIAVDALEPQSVARRRPQELKGFKRIRVVPSLAQSMNHARSGRPRFHFSTSRTRDSTVTSLSL